MKKYLIGFLSVLLTVSLAWAAGRWNPNGFGYAPQLTTQGSTDYNNVNISQNRIDARLGKEIWLGDPNYGSTLQTTITAIGSNPATLHLPAGTYSINSNYTIPANIALKHERGAIYSISTGVTLTINGDCQAGNYQIFSCTGTGNVIFGQATVNPYWWQPSGQTDWTASFAAAITASPTTPIKSPFSDSARQSISVPPGVYPCNILLNRSNVTIKGAGRGATVLIPYNTSNPVITVGGGVALVGSVSMSDFSIGYFGSSSELTPTFSTPSGILLNGVYWSNFNNFDIFNLTGDGITLNPTNSSYPNYYNHFTNFTIWYCHLAGIRSARGARTPPDGNNASFFDNFNIQGSNYGSSATGAPAAITGALAYGTNGRSYILWLEDNETYYNNDYGEESSDCGIFLHNGAGFYANNFRLDGIADGGSLVAVQFDQALTYPISDYIRGNFECGNNWKFADATTVGVNYYGYSFQNALSGPTILDALHFANTTATNYLGAGQFNAYSNTSITNIGGHLELSADKGIGCTKNLDIYLASPELTLSDATSGLTASVQNSAGNMVLTPGSGKAVQILGPIQGLPTTNGPVGTFTAAAGTTSTVSNTAATSNSKVFLTPTNAAAATLFKGGWYHSSNSSGTSFTITFQTSAAGTETFEYEMLN